MLASFGNNANHGCDARYVGIYILDIQQHFKAKEVLEGGEKAQKASYAFYGLIVTCGCNYYI